MQEKRTYRLAIAGCGKVAHLHARAIKEISNARLSAVWSRTAASAREFGKQYAAVPYDDVETMVSQEEIDLVVICTPHPYHLKPAREAANAGAHLLVEKPLASSLPDAHDIISICKRNKVKLGVVSQRRWYEPSIRAKQAIEQGKIGKPVLGVATLLGWRNREYYEADAWRGTWDMEGGGVLVNQAPHQLDLLLWYMGEIDQVFGSWHNLNHSFIEVDDTALAIIKFRNGGVGNVLVSNSQKPGIHGKVHIHGENGSSVGVQTEGGAMFIAGTSGIAEAPYNDLWTVEGEENYLMDWKEKDAEVFFRLDPTVAYIRYQQEDFLRALAGGTDPLVTGEDGLKVVELFTAIYRSTRDNLPMKFPLTPEHENNDFDGRNSALNN